MYMPTLSEAKAIAEKGEYKTIPVSCEMYSAHFGAELSQWQADNKSAKNKRV